MTLGVPGDVEKPLVSVQGAEDREGVVGGERFEGLVGGAGGFEGAGAELFKRGEDLLGWEFAFGADFDGGLRFAGAGGHDAFEELGFALGLGFPLGVGGGGESAFDVLVEPGFGAHDVFGDEGDGPAFGTGLEVPLFGSEVLGGGAELGAGVFEEGDELLAFVVGDLGIGGEQGNRS